MEELIIEGSAKTPTIEFNRSGELLYTIQITEFSSFCNCTIIYRYIALIVYNAIFNVRLLYTM